LKIATLAAWIGSGAMEKLRGMVVKAYGPDDRFEVSEVAVDC
jgi:hypothetical protein